MTSGVFGEHGIAASMAGTLQVHILWVIVSIFRIAQNMYLVQLFSFLPWPKHHGLTQSNRCRHLIVSAFGISAFPRFLAISQYYLMDPDKELEGLYSVNWTRGSL